MTENLLLWMRNFGMWTGKLSTPQKAAVLRNPQKLLGMCIHECSRGFAPIPLSPSMKIFLKGAKNYKGLMSAYKIIGTARYSRTAYAEKHNSTYLTPSYYISPSQYLVLITDYKPKLQCLFTRDNVAHARHVQNCLFHIVKTSPLSAVWNKWNYIICVKWHVQVICRPTFIDVCCRTRVTANLSRFKTPGIIGNFSDISTWRSVAFKDVDSFFHTTYAPVARYVTWKHDSYIYIYKLRS